MTPYERYHWLLLQFFRVFGVLMRLFAVAGVTSLFIERLSGSSVPNFGISFIFCTVFFIAGYWLSRLARHLLTWADTESVEYLKIMGWYQSAAGIQLAAQAPAPVKPLTGDLRAAFYISLVAVFTVVLVSSVDYALHRGPLEKGQWELAARNYPKALELLEPLAKQGNPDAQIDVARMYENGWGVKQDTAEAYYWYRIEKWYQTDNRYRDIPTWNKLEASLSDKQKSDVFNRVLAWKPSQASPSAEAKH